MTDLYYTYSIYDPELNMEYIGSRTCAGITCVEDDDLYRGTVTSKRWKNEWKEISARSIKTILKVFDCPTKAIEHEIFLHKRDDVAYNPRFFNQARQTSSGFRSVGGWTISDGHKKTISNRHKNKVVSSETRERISRSKSGVSMPDWVKRDKSKYAIENNAARFMNDKKLVCPHCEFETSPGNAKRWHFDNCKEAR